MNSELLIDIRHNYYGNKIKFKKGMVLIKSFGHILLKANKTCHNPLVVFY